MADPLLRDLQVSDTEGVKFAVIQRWLKEIQSAVVVSGNGTVTSVSVATANGVSGVVANPTTTPVITLTLGAITPTSVQSNSLTSVALSDLVLATGTSGTALSFISATNRATFTGQIIGSGSLNALNVAAGITPATELEVDSSQTVSPRGIMSAQYNTGTNGAHFHMRKARGTRVGPLTVASGDVIGLLVGAAHDGSNFLEMTAIQMNVDAAPAATKMPTNIQFKTGTNATPSVLTLALTIDSAQVSTFAGRIIGSGSLNAINVAAGITPAVELEVDSTQSTSPRGIMSANYTSDGEGARLHLRKARGTRAAPTIITTGDNLGRIVGSGWDGANYLEMANILFNTVGTIAATRIPTQIQMQVATDAAPSVLTTTALFSGTAGITLTPVGTTGAAGTAVVTAQLSTSKVQFSERAAGFAYIHMLATATAATAANFVLACNGGGVFLASPTNSIILQPAGTTSVTFVAFNTLLGGLNVNGTGMLQFPAGTTTANGITFGTDVNIFRSGTTALTITTSATGIRFSGYGSGAITSDVSGNLTAVSDGRMKTGIRAFTRGLAEILALRPVTYKWAHNSGMETEHEYSGFVAQDVREAIPEAVFVAKDGLMSFSDRPVTAALVNSIRELERRIFQLENPGALIS